MKESKEQVRKNIGTMLIIVALCVLIILVVFLLSSEKHADTVSDTTTVGMTGLVCEKVGTDNEYFNKERAPIDGKHEIRANFSDGKLVDLMYSYEAVYNAGVDLTHIKDVAEANFNLDYGNTYVYKNNWWTTSYMVNQDSNSVKMNVYAGVDSLNSGVAKVFQLERGEEFPKTEEATKSAYERTGFSCSIIQK